ncbi:alpha-1,6-mannosylglycoprotein 6-beta-N-acetylglucosaminyltransferase B isoform X5 [Channa argus]|uniref:alpha-1,6-mannosylglycoprotein 6-beta-N-acetylglucosaminyltransferase B isoform X5 n=1 Tax=Channa argus TaxID=215402 RepID=UPI0035229F04
MNRLRACWELRGASLIAASGFDRIAHFAHLCCIRRGWTAVAGIGSSLISSTPPPTFISVECPHDLVLTHTSTFLIVGVLGGQESRGVLRKISDMLEVIMKRMDALSKLGNTTDAHRLDELSSALDSYCMSDIIQCVRRGECCKSMPSTNRMRSTNNYKIQPVGLVERIQAIAQNMSDMAVRVEQILQRSMAGNRVRDGALGQCEIPKDPHYPDCPSKMDWMRARWTSDPCYAFYGVDGSDCSFLIYLSEVEWFCPPLAWRNQTATPTWKPPPKRQAVFQFDIGTLLEQVGTGKESLSFMKRRIRRLAAQWASAARRLDDKLRNHWREQKRILVHVGFLTEESGDVFSPKVLKGGPLGEMVQWADIVTALHVLGHDLKISVSLKELHGFLGVPPGRGSCPLTGPLPFDLIYTDYHGLQQMKQHMGLSLRKHKCHIRVIDTFGTEPAYNHEEYATLHGYRTNWGYWNLHSQQYMTMFPHTPDNSFMGFVAEELNETERLNIQRNKVNNMAVVYGKEASMWKGKEKFLAILHRYMEIHGTVYYETQRPPEVPAFVKNHGLLPQQELQQLLRRAKVSSQHPYAEQYVGRPHVITVDFNNSEAFDATIREIMKINVEPFLPYEYTCEGMLERVHAYVQNQDFCSPDDPFPPVNTSRSWLGSSPSPFTLLPNSSVLMWASNTSSYTSWPPLSALRLLASLEDQSCVSACQSAGLICEPAFYRFINIKEAFSALDFQCEGLESEMNHLYPAFSAEHAECGLQQDALLFSCAGSSAKHQRLCPCRDYRIGQVALCRDCL